MNEKACDLDHPKRCFRFCDYGPKHKNGCKRGKECQYWHPRLCRFSVQGKECDVSECTFQHLISHRKPKNTEKTAERATYRRRAGNSESASDKEITDTRGLRYPRVSLTSSTGQTPYPSTIRKTALDGSKTNEDTNQESFLLKLIENMRAGFQEQIDGLKKEIVKGREQEPRQQPIQIGAPLPNQGMYTEQPHPVFRAYPGAIHPNIQMMMANQNHQVQQQWINQNQPYQTLSS